MECHYHPDVKLLQLVKFVGNQYVTNVQLKWQVEIFGVIVACKKSEENKF